MSMEIFDKPPRMLRICALELRKEVGGQLVIYFAIWVKDSEGKFVRFEAHLN